MEVCVDSLTSAVRAQKGGADCIELCQNLRDGGFTPSIGLLRKVKSLLRIPVNVLIRPRGGDFIYSEPEMLVMEEDIDLAKQYGADGFTIGALTVDGTVDVPLCRRLVSRAGMIPVTFNRAFDLSCNPLNNLEEIIDLGCRRLLTSGLAADCQQGIPMINCLLFRACDRINIIPAGGINESNLRDILTSCGVRAFHTSASVSVVSEMLEGPHFADVNLGRGCDTREWRECCDKTVAKLIEIAHSVW